MKRMTLDVPESFHRDLKTAAAAAGVTLKRFVMVAVHEKIEKDKFVDGLREVEKEVEIDE